MERDEEGEIACGETMARDRAKEEGEEERMMSSDSSIRAPAQIEHSLHQILGFSCGDGG